MLAVAFALAVTCAAGAYLATSRDLLRAVIGLSLLGSAVNLALFAAGRLGPSAPPILEAGQVEFGAVANPLPQALVLTAIVIGFALTCFTLVLVLRLIQGARVEDAAQLRLAEPLETHAVKPPVESDEFTCAPQAKHAAPQAKHAAQHIARETPRERGEPC